jgi:DNA-binding CsgD family transcriptional regulator
MLDSLRAVQEQDLSEEARQLVDEQIAFQRLVQRTELAFQHLGARLDCGLLVVDERGVVTYSNDRMAEMIRAPRSQLLGQFVATWLAPGDKPIFFRNFKMRRRGDSSPYPLRVKRGDDSWLFVSITPFPRFDEQGNFRGTFALIFETEAPAEQQPAASIHKKSEIEALSRREREILDTLLAGQSIEDIAKVLHISQHTVRNHIKAIYRKLGVHSRSELLRQIIGP